MSIERLSYERGQRRATLELGRLAHTPHGHADAAHLLLRRIKHDPSSPFDKGYMHALEGSIPPEWQTGYDNADKYLGEIPGPAAPALLLALLKVTPDEDDDLTLDAGFRARLRDALDDFLCD